jgi:predicted AlkP superfamily phosphohydrolase/phosphomutase
MEKIFLMRRYRILIVVALPLALLALGGSCGKTPTQKVFVLGIDGLTFDLLLPWAQQGKLPNFARLLEEGSSTQLISAVPPYSPPAWTSAVTGVNPGKHGIFGFVKGIDRQEGQPNLIYYTALDRQVDPLWVLLTERGRRSVVVNVPCSSPPDKLRGVMISGFPHTSLTNFTYPPEYRFKIPDYRKDIYGQLVRVNGEENFLKDMDDIMNRRIETIEKLLDEESWDLFFAVFTITDRVQHYFWKFMDPRHPRWNADKARLYGDAILESYQKMDAFLGQLRPRLDDHTSLLVMSDHGFGPVYQPVNGQNFLDRLEVPEDFSVMAADNFGAKFHITTTKKPPYDQRTQEAYAQTRELLNRELNRLRDPATGENVIREIVSREDLYWGPQSQQGPDIMGLENKGYLFWNWYPTEDGELFPDPEDPTLEQFFSAFHLLNGILIASGANVRSGRNNFDAQIMDIAPTVLYLLGELVPQDMDGAVLTEIVAPEYTQLHPVEARWDRTSRPRVAQSVIDSTEAINRFIEEQLRAIGYVQ